MYVLRKSRILRLTLILLVMVCVAVIPFLFGEYAFAEESTDPGQWLNTFGNWVGNIILSIAAAFTWLGGQLFDLAFDDLVLGMGQQIQPSSGIGASIDLTWTIIRDFANLAFIFGFIYIGVKTILDYENANTKRFLVTLIIAALLINFSLFVTKFVVDTSNFLATQIYTQVLGDNDSSIGLLFADTMGIVSIYESPDPENFARLTTSGNIWFFIMGALFLFVAAFVLAAGGILLVIRFVALVLIMIFSPVLFAAMVFPQTQGYAKKLWSQLFAYSFFAPVYLLFVFISLKILQESKRAFGGSSFSDALTNVDAQAAAQASQQIDSFGVILNFVIIIMFMIFSLIASQKLSIYGGNQAVAIGNKWGRRAAGGSTFGLVGAFGRNTFGRGAARLTEIEGLRDYAARSRVGRTLFSGAQSVAGSSFDARRVGDIGKELNIGVGSGKGGYTQRQKDISEKEVKFAKSLDTNKGIVAIAEKMNETEIRSAESEIERISNEINRTHKDDTGALVKLESEKERAQARKQKLENARKEAVASAKSARQRMYADTLASGRKYNVKFVVQTKRENKNAAEAIRKEVKKDANDKIVDAIKEIDVKST